MATGVSQQMPFGSFVSQIHKLHACLVAFQGAFRFSPASKSLADLPSAANSMRVV